MDRRAFITNACGVIAVPVLGANTVAGASNRSVASAQLNGNTVANVQGGGSVDTWLEILTQGQGLWLQEDYLEPVQYVEGIPGTRTHAYWKFALGNDDPNFHGLGHRSTIIQNPGVTVDPSGGLQTPHEWVLETVEDESGQLQIVVSMILDTSRVGISHEMESFALLGYDADSRTLSVFDLSQGRDGVWTIQF
ncbi:hypothetical protein [Natronococcus amylolyticus]|uniref:hypothetical protein n=1 Tax=Natronococcus amylolyticus TaxID=44470 RepID=UPI0012680BA6|nr:hypothetical protein [Natronococcus amylolyticus]